MVLSLPLPPPRYPLHLGRATYKFASFWNRGHTYRVLQDSVSEFWRQQEAAAAEEEQALLRCSSSLKDGHVHGDDSLAGAASRAIDRVEEKEDEEEDEAKPFIHHKLLEPVTTVSWGKRERG